MSILGDRLHEMYKEEAEKLRKLDNELQFAVNNVKQLTEKKKEISSIVTGVMTLMMYEKNKGRQNE